jgi:hypothetical protein
MALLGARGETKEEMRSALALPANDTDIIQGKIIVQLQCFILCDKNTRIFFSNHSQIHNFFL